MFKNRIINGAMMISQAASGTLQTINSGSQFYPVDRFVCQGQSTDGVFTAQQVSDAPTGFTNSIKITVTTADASIGSTQYYMMQQRIEGYNVSDLGFGTAGASTVTLSFWAKSSVTGTFGGSLSNSAVDRSYPFAYTINSANTWEYKTVTIAGDTTGTWVKDNGLGLRVYWNVGAGSSYTAAAGAWAGQWAFNATGATNLIATVNATLQITGVQLEKGSTATSFDYRPYGTELALCQRYCFAMRPSTNYGRYGVGTSETVGNLGVIIYPPVSMRAAPSSLTTASAASYAIYQGSSIVACTSITLGADSSVNALLVNFSTSGGQTAGYSAHGLSNNNQTSYLIFSSEL